MTDELTTAPIANPSDAEWVDDLYLLSFGAYGTTRVFAWASSLDSAWEIAVDWLDDKGLAGIFTTITDEDLAAAAAEIGVAWPTEDDEQRGRVYEAAEADLTMVSHTTLRNCGPGPHYVPSWEWTAVGPEWLDREVVAAVRARSLDEVEAA